MKTMLKMVAEIEIEIDNKNYVVAMQLVDEMRDNLSTIKRRLAAASKADTNLKEVVY